MHFNEKVLAITYWALACVCNYHSVSARVNIAGLGTAKQSSTLLYGKPVPFYWNASLAINGNKTGRDNINTEPTCSGTGRQNQPWWLVDLYTDHDIGKINVYGRLDTPLNLLGFRVFVTSTESLRNPSGDLVYEDNITEAQYGSQSATYNIVTSRRGRYVLINLPKSSSHLVLCEVEVYEVCPYLTHEDGDVCSKCGFCKHNESCRRSDGTCPNGCAPGYIPHICKSECPNGKYGQNCENRCGNCRNNDPCNKVNGNCIRCAPGYKGHLCAEECDDFSYGDKCQSKCGNCKDDSPCDHITGACSGCKAGFYLQLCTTACLNYRYGEDCALKCGHCKAREVCDKKDGRCSACADGYAGAQCKNVCPDDSYGENCRYTCGHCRNEVTCNHVTGLCDSCANGYNNSDKFCKTECSDFRYGYQCRDECGHCKNNMPCIKTNGTCGLGCSIGYEGDRCQSECSGRKFGEDCSKSCHCKGDAKCDVKTGHCPRGLCGEGWGGSDCNTDLNLIDRLRLLSITTSMSTPVYDGMNSTLAVDGNESPQPDTCHCCSVTIATNPWWILDLHMMLPIKRLIFIGRSESGKYDQFKEFRIYLSNTSGVYGEPVYQHSKWTWQSPRYIIPVPIYNYMARFMKIDREENILTICEVKLYEGDCPAGRYGDGCGYRCHCSDRLKCDLLNGTCQSGGCLPGWQGYACNKECLSGTFGVNCSSECHCNINSQCNKESGNCGSSGCAPGWTEHNCSEVCDMGLFGFNCSNPCRCRNNKTCDHITGQCFDGLCEKGYQGLNCSLTCDLGFFGLDCSSECHCQQNILCDHVTGTCNDGICSAGYQGVNCSLPCYDGYYGVNCSEPCGNCANNITCDRMTGHCESGCDEKHKGLRCKSKISEWKREDGGMPGSISGVLVGIAVLIVFVVAVAVFIIRKRRGKDATVHSPGPKTYTELGRANVENGVRETSLCRGFSTADAEHGDVTDSEYYSFSPRLTDLKIYDLWDYINQNKANGVEYLYNEYQKLPRGLIFACEVAKRPENYSKNRYKDMYAYDHSRVVLCEKDESDSDYINACYVNGYETIKKFIAAQGPAKATINDFWKMIWQENVHTIVMLTNLIEMGNLKCVQYWPDCDRISYGSLTVIIKDTEEHTDYAVRNLELEKDNDDLRLVKQYHFKAWPDKAVPDASWSLVQFWRAVSEYAEPPNSGGPIVVHCSAGVGRTGTFIALDNLYHQAMTEGCLRPLQMVETLRRQRVNMVQTKDQYVFLHEAVAEAYYFGTSSVFVNQFKEWYNIMCGTDQDSGKCRLNIQYELLAKSLISNQSTKDDDTNAIYSNAAEEQRDKVGGTCSEKGWSQIEVEAFNGKKCFMICKTPTADDHDSFYQLIKQKHIKTVIAISESKKTLLKDEEVKEFTINCAPDQLLPQDMDDLILVLNNIQSWQPFLNDTQPILVHCRSELSRCLVICILLGEIQRQTLDGAVNILAATKKALCDDRSTLVPSFEQYKFCHDVILQIHRQPDVYANI